MLGASIRAYVICAVLQTLIFDHYRIPFAVNAAVMMSLVWLYTRRGGVQSVIWTDLLKTACLIGSVVLCIVFMTRELGLGAAETAVQVADHDFAHILLRRSDGSPLLLQTVLRRNIHGRGDDWPRSGHDAAHLSCRNYRDSQKNMIISILLQTG